MRKIRLLFIHNQLVCGGAEQALFDLVTLMDKNKFDITVLVQYEGGIWEQKFRDAGIRVVSIWDCQQVSSNPFVKLSNLISRRQIVRALKQGGEGMIKACFGNNLDLIISYSGSTMQKMCFSGNIKTIKYIHGDIATNPPYRKNVLGIIDHIRKFDRIICVSAASKESFMRITGITEDVVTYYNPLNSYNVLALAQQEIELSCDVPLICAVGRLAEEKGFDRLIRIHKKILDDGIPHKLVIVGDGDQNSRLMNIITELYAEDSVIMTGYQANPYPYMRKSDFLVCSSYTEGLPVIAMEALCLGIPIVSSAPSVGEAFGDEPCGLITDSDDESLEAGIRKMLTDTEFYKKAKSAALRRSAFFDGRRMVRVIEEEFISLVESK